MALSVRRAGKLTFGGLVLAAALAAAPAFAQDQVSAYPVATDFRVGGDAKQTRFVLDLNRKVEMRAFTLADPYRVVIDLPQVTFKLPPQAGESGRGLVKAFRYGLVMQGGSRVVLDVTGPVRVDKAFMIEAADGQPARMVLDISATDRDTFMRASAIDNRLQRNADAPPPVREPATGDPRPMIVLDPGHGGIDTGTKTAAGQMEKDIALEFALALRDKLERTGKYRVVMTRTEDTFVELADRVRFARARKAQLFISIHCDALPRAEGDAQGATVYTLSDKASDAQAALLAEAENRADVIAGVDLSAEPNDIADILIDLAQRETKTFSTHFSRMLVTELKTAARMHKHPQKSAGFRVLKAPDVPSVLLELGYLSNRDDLKQLTSDAWRQRAGDALVQAIAAYFTTRVAGSGAN